MNTSRRDFLKKGFKVSFGVAALSALPAGLMAFAEEENTQPDYEWVPNLPACKLIEETTNDKTPEGTRSFFFITDGRTCSSNVAFDIVGTERLIQNVKYEAGCSGGTQGVSAMAEGRPADEVVKLLKNVICDGLKSGSSCPQQLAYGVNQALIIMDGFACPGCEGTVCKNITK